MIKTSGLSIRKLSLIAMAAICLVVTAVFVIGCGGSPAPQGSPLSDEQVLAVLGRIQAKAESLPETDGIVDQAAMVSFIRSQTEVATVESQPGTIWVQFTNDEELYFVNNRRVRDSEMRPGSLATEPHGIPLSGNAYVFDTLGTCFHTAASEVATTLTSAGYTIQNTSRRGTVDALKTVTNAGVFYIDSHGGASDFRYAISTDTPVNAETMRAYRADRAGHRLVYMEAARDRRDAEHCTKPNYFAITPAFVSRYMTFSQHAFVFSNACSSFNTAMSDAMYAKGVGVYTGWSQPVDDDFSNRAAAYLFHHLTFMSAAPGVEHALNYDAIKQLMHTATPPLDRYEDTKYGTMELFIEPYTRPVGSGDMGTLNPVIESASQSARTLTLTGSFGRFSSAVLINGASVSITSWNETTIVCALPSGLQGNVTVVAKVDARRSNVYSFNVQGEGGAVTIPTGTYEGAGTWKLSVRPIRLVISGAGTSSDPQTITVTVGDYVNGGITYYDPYPSLTVRSATRGADGSIAFTGDSTTDVDTSCGTGAIINGQYTNGRYQFDYSIGGSLDFGCRAYGFR